MLRKERIRVELVGKNRQYIRVYEGNSLKAAKALRDRLRRQNAKARALIIINQ